MDYNALFERILGQVDQAAYMPLADAVDAPQREAMTQVERQLRDPSISAQATEDLIHGLHESGRIDRVNMMSALHVLAASPKVGDFDLAARYVAEQEMAALTLGGPRLESNLASVDRHRGVLAFLNGRFSVALDYFSRAFERQHTAGNLSNVLATLIRLGDADEARDLLRQVRAAFAPDFTEALNSLIAQDPDLAMLREEEHAC